MARTDHKNNELEELLPAYVNGTLSNEQQAVVEAYIANHSDARADVIWLRTLRQRMRVLSTDISPGTIGWQHLRRSLRTAGRVNARHGSNGWIHAMAAAALIIVMQTSMLIGLSPWQEALRLLSGPTNAEQFNGKVQALCQSSKRQQAQASAKAYYQKLMADKTVQKIKACSE
jgi:anti-sigma factor RsiW